MSAKGTSKATSLRKTHAIKRTDGEPLTRQDLQYDLLRCIFDDQSCVFTDPYQPLKGGEPGKKVTFRDLYVNTLINSPKSSKAIRDKISEAPEFGTDFAMISLLANVGRINTTMAFFPETRTALRTYHPVPALQKTDGTLQDAPRIKTTLKTSLLPNETESMPTTPSDILTRRRQGRVPSTSVVNLLFVLNNHSYAVGRSSLDEECGLDFTDLFLPIPIPSAARARAFLWLCFHYLEPLDDPNPYDDPDSTSEGRAPRLSRLPAEDYAVLHENVDSPEELAIGKRLAEHRRVFLATDSIATAVGRFSEHDMETPPGKKSKQKGKPHNVPEPPIRGRPTNVASREALLHKNTHARISGEQYSRLSSLQPAPNAFSEKMKGRRARKGKDREQNASRQGYDLVYSPPSPERTMFEHAWHVVSTTDPLDESDEEHGDEHTRLDYTRRLQTLKRLRGKSPTPEPAQPPVPPPTMEVDGLW